MIVPLERALDRALHGGKAVSLGAALRNGLPVPDGLALSWQGVRQVLDGQDAAWAELEAQVDSLGAKRLAVRSSAVDEDGEAASFAGIHDSVLGVCGSRGLRDAVLRVARSATTPSAAAYRQRLGLSDEPKLAVVLQECVDATSAGVLFTRCPVTGRDERVIEAAWGLGESVVAGLVAPDRFRVARGGTVLERCAGDKPTAVRLADGEIEACQVGLDEADARRLCLADHQLAHLDALASACDTAFESADHDIEWAFADERLFLLQRRPITR